MKSFRVHSFKVQAIVLIVEFHLSNTCRFYDRACVIGEQTNHHRTHRQPDYQFNSEKEWVAEFIQGVDYCHVEIPDPEPILRDE